MSWERRNGQPQRDARATLCRIAAHRQISVPRADHRGDSRSKAIRADGLQVPNALKGAAKGSLAKSRGRVRHSYTHSPELAAFNKGSSCTPSLPTRGTHVREVVAVQSVELPVRNGGRIGRDAGFCRCAGKARLRLEGLESLPRCSANRTRRTLRDAALLSVSGPAPSPTDHWHTRES